MSPEREQALVKVIEALQTNFLGYNWKEGMHKDIATACRAFLDADVPKPEPSQIVQHEAGLIRVIAHRNPDTNRWSGAKFQVQHLHWGIFDNATISDVEQILALRPNAEVERIP